MTPRRYDLTKRATASAETRRRIVSAALELHTEKGILGTSWRDIARRADVAVATMYNHFPSLDELVPACGEMLMDRLRPPSPEDAERIIADARTPRERLERVAQELFAFYERAGDHIRVFPGERELPAMQEWEEYQRATVAAFVRAALAGTRPTARTVEMISAFLDLATFTSLRSRGIAPRKAASTMAQAAASVLEVEGTTKPFKTRRR